MFSFVIAEGPAVHSKDMSRSLVVLDGSTVSWPQALTGTNDGL